MDKKNLPSKFLVISSLLGVVVVAAILIKLAFWQLERAATKLQYQQQLSVRKSTQWLELPTVTVDKSFNNQGIKVSGRLLHQFTWLLDNQVENGRVGYQVLVPLQLANDNRVIIANLGWVKGALDRTILPTLKMWIGEQQVSGFLHLPNKNPYQLTAAPTAQWPKVIGEIDFSRFGQQLQQAGIGLAVYPAILRVASNSVIGYQKSWRWSNKMSVEKHQGYAFQWFALAFTLVLLTAYFSIRLHKEVS